MKKAIKHAGFWWRYDETADTLHVAVDPSIPAYGETLRNFENVVVVMHSIEDDRIVGIRILGAKQNGLQEIKLLVDQEKRAIGAIQVSGRTPDWKPDADFQHYAKDLEAVEKILEKPPTELQLA